MPYSMRQAKRAITDPDELVRILQNCDVCHLGLADGGEPYVVPLNYGFDWQDGRLLLYFHCAAAGRKLDMIRSNNRAFFQMDGGHVLKTAATACGWSMNYDCIMGSGSIEIVQDAAERLAGLRAIMRHYDGATGGEPAPGWLFDPENLARTVIMRLRADEWTGKALKK
jgi:uncharacterized protein